MLGLLILLLILFVLFGGYGSGRDWGYYAWGPLGLIVVLILVLWLAGVVRAEELPASAVGGGIFFVGALSRASGKAERTGPPGLPYQLSYALAIVCMIGLAVVGYVTTEWTLGHGADMGITPQTFSIISMIGVGLGVLAGVLPNVQHNPSFRKRELLHAAAGRFPRDLRHLRAGGEPPPTKS